MDFRYDTFCGLYCGACDVFIANMNSKVEALAQAWKMDLNQLKCHGCKSTVNAIYCMDCDIKKCAQNRDIEYCFQCEEYPCSRLVAFRNDEHPHHSIVLQNLGFIQSQGSARWLEKQKERWSCPNCGTGFSWYAKTCEICGGALHNCQDEEQEIINFQDLEGSS